MAQRKGGFRGTFNRCERPGCGVPAAKWSVYSDRMLCNSCLSFERTAALAQQPERDAIAANVAQAAAEIAAANAQRARRNADAAELEAVLQAEYRDEYETRRDLTAGALQ